MSNDIYHSAYFQSILNPNMLKKVVRRLVSDIKEFQKTNQIDAIAVRGMSGALMGGIVSSRLSIPLLCVRKGKQSHSNFRVEGYISDKTKDLNYIIIDDLICSGGTINAIERDIRREMKLIRESNSVKSKAILKGVFLYNDTGWDTWGTSNVPIACFRIKVPDRA